YWVKPSTSPSVPQLSVIELFAASDAPPTHWMPIAFFRLGEVLARSMEPSELKASVPVASWLPDRAGIPMPFAVVISTCHWLGTLLFSAMILKSWGVPRLSKIG